MSRKQTFFNRLVLLQHAEQFAGLHLKPGSALFCKQHCNDDPALCNPIHLCLGPNSRLSFVFRRCRHISQARITCARCLSSLLRPFTLLILCAHHHISHVRARQNKNAHHVRQSFQLQRVFCHAWVLGQVVRSMFLRCTLRQWLLPLPKGTLLRSLFFGFVLLDLICVVSYHDHRVPHRKSRVNSIVRFLSQDAALDIVPRHFVRCFLKYGVALHMR